MDVEEQAVLSGFSIQIKVWIRRSGDCIFPGREIERSTGIGELANRTIRFSLPRRHPLRAVSQFRTVPDNGSIDFRDCGRAKSEWPGRRLRIADVLKKVDLGGLVVRQGLMEFLAVA